MRAKTCTCRLWQICGIPCVHAAASILKCKHPLTDYVSPYYSRTSMAALYEHALYPINGMDNWPRTTDVGFELDPPNTKRQRGRPRKTRREQTQVRFHENGVESLQRTPVISCSRCGQTGHNKRTCQNDPRTIPEYLAAKVLNHLLELGDRRAEGPSSSGDNCLPEP